MSVKITKKQNKSFFVYGAMCLMVSVLCIVSVEMGAFAEMNTLFVRAIFFLVFVSASGGAFLFIFFLGIAPHLAAITRGSQLYKDVKIIHEIFPKIEV